jgi:hypothetical protein
VEVSAQPNANKSAIETSINALESMASFCRKAFLLPIMKAFLNSLNN